MIEYVVWKAPRMFQSVPEGDPLYTVLYVGPERREADAACEAALAEGAWAWVQTFNIDALAGREEAA